MIKNSELQNEIKPYLKIEDGKDSIAFKVGFLACIKSVEDYENYKLAEKLKTILKAI